MSSSAFEAILKAIPDKTYEVFYTLNGDDLFRVVGIIKGMVLYEDSEPGIVRLLMDTTIDPEVDIDITCIVALQELTNELS